VSEPVAASSRQNPLCPEPISPTLNEFGLSEGDLQRLPRLWFDEFGSAASKRFFYTYVAVCIATYVSIFRDGIHLSIGYVVGFFAFAFVSVIPFGLFWLIMGVAERQFYIALNEGVANYCRYQSALSVYRRRKADYDARLAKQRATYWRSLSGVTFENELGKLFRRMGL
jgi:hypothetical protein